MRSIHVGIVNFESGARLGELVDSIERARGGAATRVAVTVVDNASSDGSAELEAFERSTFECVREGSNRGFGAAANRAFEASDADWFVVMNADLVVPEDFFAALGRTLSRVNVSVGLVAPQLRNPDGSLQPSIGRFPTLIRTALQAFLPRSRRRYLPVADHVRRRIEWATGACLAVRRDAWRMVGGFDERFFLYYEDVDLCRRLSDAGVECRFEPDVCVTHVDPLAQRAPATELVATIRYSHLLYFAKHRPRWEFSGLALATRLLGLRADSAIARTLRSLPSRVRRGMASPLPSRQSVVRGAGGTPSAHKSG